jgi:general stress protein 26
MWSLLSSDKQRIVDILRENCLHAYLATSHKDQPFVRPVSPIVEDDMSIWVTTFSTSRKIGHINENPRICLAFVEQPSGDKAAVVFGEARIVSDLENKRRVWALAPFDLSQHFPNGPESSEFCLLRIVPRRIEWRSSWEGGTNIYEPT